jgi:glutamyl-tRNA synthetase
MKQDLRWLGITWDGEVCQSKRLPLYRAALETLLARGLVYRCTCSRRDLALAMSAPHEDGVLHDPEDEPVYSGKCRPETNLSTTFVDDANYRFRVTDGEAVAFDDIHAGAQIFVAGKDFGDFLVWRKDGLPSYQLACVVDDAEMHITEVVRGGDLLKSTARQMLLQRALDLATPQYFHCDLMRDAAGIRLAKRHDALSLRALREQAMRPEELRAQFLRLNR